jgi:hypothetical protein
MEGRRETVRYNERQKKAMAAAQTEAWRTHREGKGGRESHHR